MQPEITRKARTLLLAIAILSAAGALVSSVSLHQHYAKDTTTYCDFGQTFNCDIVNRSEYSSVQGIPVALIGVAGYLCLLGLSTILRSRAEARLLLPLGSIAGLGFALYLTYVEKFKLATWCILCLSSLALIAAIAVLSILFARRAG